MSEWQGMNSAPIGEPVTVWCNILNSSLGDEREWTAVQQFMGWWTLNGRRGRIYPTHWKPLANPPSSQSINKESSE